MRGLQKAERVLEKYTRRRDKPGSSNAFINRTSPSSAQQLLRASIERHAPLSGTFIAVKDNICTSELPTTCGSQGLKDYTSPYDATVVSKVKDAGAIITGKTNLDEFGMGSHSLNSAFGPVHHGPSDSATSVGGSSGGSAMAVLTGQCDTALGTDTGGSVRLPAAYSRQYAFKPSYGLVSRWGVVAYANSLDTVGFLGLDVTSIRDVFDQCNEHDPKDPTSLRPATRARFPRSRPEKRPLRVGVPREYNIASLSKPIRDTWRATLDRLRSEGHSIHSVSLPNTRSALSAYYILAPAEASSNLAKYDSVRYGTRPASDPNEESSSTVQEASGDGGELYARVRKHGFGPEVQRRILLGAYSLSAAAMDNYFVQAQRIRRLVQRDFDAVFATPNPLRQDDSAGPTRGHGVDVLVVPTAPGLPPRLSDLEKQDPLTTYAGDVFTVPASLAGLPAAVVPVEIASRDCGTDSDSIGVQILGQFGDDQLVLDLTQQMQASIAANVEPDVAD